MPDVANIEYLNGGLFELSQNSIEKRFVVFVDGTIYETGALAIQTNVANIEVLEQPPVPAPVSPVVSNVSPFGGTAIAATDPLSFDVTDESGLFREIVVIASFPNVGLLEIIHMDAAFGPQYTQYSSRVAITNGYRYTVLRNGGWPASPTIIVKAIDLTGAENV